MKDQEYFVACATGLEGVVAAELEELGAKKIEPRVRGVSCRGPSALRYRANLWLRAGIRVLEPILREEVRNPEDLYEVVQTIDWSRYLTLEQKLSIDCRLNDSRMTHAGYAALKAKDAIVDQFRRRCGARPDAGPDDADLPIFLHIFRNKMTLSLDTSGDTLHKRGYRRIMVKSPLNESLAAGILALTGWDKASPLADPMCGSGTIPIEAALMAAGMAPGLGRRFAFERWPDLDDAAWRRARDEAKAGSKASLGFPIFASDHHAGALDLAKQAAREAGVASMIRFSVADVADFAAEPPPKLFVVNPPYGERLDADKEVYRKLGATLRRFPGSTAWVLSSSRELTNQIGFKSSKHVDLMNGDLECRLLRYDVFERR